MPRIHLWLAEHSRVYRPGEVLEGYFRLEEASTEQVRAVELSAVWHTEGKGDEDLSVHYFERLEPASGSANDFTQPHLFKSVLPPSPLSYSGLILKIRWCVRARVFLARGKELTHEVPFQLGTVPSAQSVTAT